MSELKVQSTLSESPGRTWLMLVVFGTIATLLTIYHSLLHPHPLHVFYLVSISLLLTIVIVVIAVGISKTKISLQHLSKTGIFLSIYIVLITWLAINKTIPEYNEIEAFKKKRIEIIYWHVNNGRAGIRQLSMLYMHAPPAISRIEPAVNHWGTKLMMSYLENQMKNGKDPTYRDGTYKLSDDMYELAEALFSYASRESARIWYQHAYEYGRTDAMERYNERTRLHK